MHEVFEVPAREPHAGQVLLGVGGRLSHCEAESGMVWSEKAFARARTERNNVQDTRSEGWRRSVYSGRAGSSWSINWWRRASATRLPIPAARRRGSSMPF